ncbi:hypothetical protein M5D96_005484 [Drosophila gunungcola]|uniref:protein-tyrosine-phosphatase n=1 Tax=Drosophila gunungcola TaxID=103775 RepID=A0A9P9YQC3_9MUSC|nr:hypothetical protein M5D96_005484 [Drosophila gunungcola]
MESSRNVQTDQLMGLRSLRISTPHSDSACSSSAESSDCESTSHHHHHHHHHNFNEAPVEIIPGLLFLGNASHSCDSNALQKYNIKYVLNVTPDLPNEFEKSGIIKYLQIPITDHYSQDLAMHFPDAIQFIEEARSANSAVLVHCLAGVSRSVTVTLAYLMHTRGLSLNDAFTMVRDRKPDVSPNFHFMQQLQSFESQLRLSPGDGQAMDDGPVSNVLTANPSVVASRCGRGSKFSCNCIAPDCKCMQTGGFMAAHLAKATGVSPDSGIEFDRWTPSDAEQLGGKSFVLPPSQEILAAAVATSPPPIGLAVNPDNMSPASTTSSSTSTTTTAEAVSVVEVIRELRIEGLRENWLDMGMSFEAEEMRSQSVMERFTRMIYAGTTNVDILLSDPQVRKLLTSGEKFDLLIVDLFLSDALLGLAFYYGIPTVAISPTGANSWLNNMFGNPQSSSLDPSNFLPFTERMNTWQRVLNSLMSTFERLTYNFFHLISQQSVYTNHFELLVKELPLYRDLTKNLSLALINSHPGLHYPRAYLPNMVEIGGLHLSDPNEQQLGAHLLSFMESAPSGVIYFSLGADVQTAQLPQEKLAIILDVFGHLKAFHFLVKWEKEDFAADQELPENVMIADWWPQQGILYHPQLSVWESINGQKPILAIPILADQEVMAKRLQHHGVSLTVGYDSIAYDSLLHGIRQLTLNTSYVERLGQLKDRLISRDSSPAKKALVLESGGADFLKSHANTLNFWRAEGVDVLLIIALGFCGILIIPFLAICIILRKSYHSQAAQDQPPYRTNLKRTRSAQSLSARSSSSSMSSTSPSPSTASTTPLDLTPPPAIQLLGQVPPLQLYVNHQRINSGDRKTSQEENGERSAVKEFDIPRSRVTAMGTERVRIGFGLAQGLPRPVAPIAH